MNITCGGPGPHIPSNGVLGTSDRPVTGMRCTSPSCVPAPDPRVVNGDTVRTRLQAYLNLSTTTTAQDKKAIKAIGRLLLNLLDDVSDT